MKLFPPGFADVLRRYFTVLDRAGQAIDRDLHRYLPLWRKSIPPEFQDRPWRVEQWGPGERFVFAPYPEAKLREVMAAIDRWGMGKHMAVRDLAAISKTIAR